MLISGRGCVQKLPYEIKNPALLDYKLVAYKNKCIITVPKSGKVKLQHMFFFVVKN